MNEVGMIIKKEEVSEITDQIRFQKKNWWKSQKQVFGHQMP